MKAYCTNPRHLIIINPHGKDAYWPGNNDETINRFTVPVITYTIVESHQKRIRRRSKRMSAATADSVLSVFI